MEVGRRIVKIATGTVVVLDSESPKLRDFRSGDQTDGVRSFEYSYIESRFADIDLLDETMHKSGGSRQGKETLAHFSGHEYILSLSGADKRHPEQAFPPPELMSRPKTATATEIAGWRHPSPGAY